MANLVSNSGAKVYITSAYEDFAPISDFVKYANSDKIKKHQVTHQPAEADIILFIENSRHHYDCHFTKLKKHPLVKRYPDKVFMYNPHDLPWYILPGMYTCVPKQAFNDSYVSSSPYVETINPYITCDFTKEPTFLFSFHGALTAPVRKRIVELTHPRAHIKASFVNMYELKKPEDIQKDYAALLSNTKFVLCPKGSGTSSIRLFEVLKAGRVPVILSDKWVRPRGADWDKFAIFIPENKVSEIPVILEKAEANWFQMAQLARQTWEELFAPQTIFNYFIDCILRLDVKQPHTLAIKYQDLLSFTNWYVRKHIREKIKNPLFALLTKFKKFKNKN